MVLYRLAGAHDPDLDSLIGEKYTSFLGRRSGGCVMAIATIKGVFGCARACPTTTAAAKTEHIAAAVEEAQSGISSGDAPIVAMLTHGGARVAAVETSPVGWPDHEGRIGRRRRMARSRQSWPIPRPGVT